MDRGMASLLGQMQLPGLGRAVVACTLSVTMAGCAEIRTRDEHLKDVIEDHWERFEATHTRNVSDATGAVLARLGLAEPAQRDPASTARVLGARLQSQQSRPGLDEALVLAELSYRAGLTRQTVDPSAAIAWYRDAAAIAALTLAEAAGSQRDMAVQIHNQSVARLIRTAQSSVVRRGRSWRDVLCEQKIQVGSSSPYLEPTRIADLRVTSDFRVEGMNHVYYTNGLGVPVVAHRWAGSSRPGDPADQFLPGELRAAATAVMAPVGGLAGADWKQQPITLFLFDPFLEQAVAIGNRSVSLASDRTTPLAMQVTRGQLAALEWTGLFDSNFERPGLEAGLYLIRPYEPGKIPVVFVHGLFSSPRAWVQTINELQNTPALASQYQFWMFIYPTGQPIPTSAAQLRESLVRARGSLDPQQIDAALDRMVLVGHSMGGLLSKMMAQDSGTELWDAVITVPRDRFKAPPDLKQALDSTLTYQRLPFVQRVVFIATPHRGSPIADSAFGQVISDLVRLPAKMDARIAEIEALNGPNVVSRELRGHAINSIANLRTDSPILATLNRIGIHQSVPYHSIIPLIDGVLNTDGVVEYRSSHLDGAKSELIVPGTHSSQQHPDVTRELDHILQLHLATTEAPASVATGRANHGDAASPR
jgi:pimeloyl-ACP methyl ester carboxylesterase